MRPLINNANELIRFLELSVTNQRSKKAVYVSSDIRKEFLISEKQGEIVANGKHYKVLFENKRGGVWLVQVRTSVHQNRNTGPK